MRPEIQAGRPPDHWPGRAGWAHVGTLATRCAVGSAMKTIGRPALAGLMLLGILATDQSTVDRGTTAPARSGAPGSEPAVRTAATACRPSVTQPYYRGRDGRVTSTGGHPPVTNGPFQGRTAVLAIVSRVAGREAAKLWHVLETGGPDLVRVRAVRLDGSDRATFSLGGIAPRVATLVLRRADLHRRFAQPGSDDAFAPGGMYVSRPGCYRLSARWRGGGYSMVVHIL